MSILNIENAQVIVNNQIIFTDVNINVDRGQCHGLIGADNEGKTSLIYCILGLNKLTSGTIKLFDTINPSNRNKYMNKVAFVPDELLCFEHMTGAQFIDMTMQLRHQKDWLDEAEQLIEYFEVNPAEQLTYMSEDMNKCIYIISALLSKPELLILDEPFNFLSDKNADKLKEWLLAYTADGGTVLFVSDSFNSIADICNVVTTMKNRTIASDSLPIDSIKKFKLITATGIDLKTIPEEFTVVDHNTRYCKMIYKGESARLKSLLNDMLCKDFTIEDITLEDILYNTYDWLEDVL